MVESAPSELATRRSRPSGATPSGTGNGSVMPQSPSRFQRCFALSRYRSAIRDGASLASVTAARGTPCESEIHNSALRQGHDLVLRVRDRERILVLQPARWALQ